MVHAVAAADTCVMCELARGTRDAALLCGQNQIAVALVDRFAAAPGHLLIVLREHHEDFSALPTATYLEFQTLVQHAARKLQRHFRPLRVFVGMFGTASDIGISFPHVHAHLVPIMKDDESMRPARIFSWSSGVWVYDPGEAEALARMLSD